MQYELYMMKNIVKMIKEGKLLSELPLEEIKNIEKIVIDKGITINEIEPEIKRVTDSLALKYGLLEALKILMRVREDAIELKTRDENPIYVPLFTLSVTNMYKQLEKAYAANVYLKVYALLPRFYQKTIERGEFLELITKTSVPVKRILGLKESEEGIQDSLFGLEIAEDPMESVKNAFSFRQNIAREVKQALKQQFSPGEISRCCGEMLDLLMSSSLEEHRIIARILSQIVAPELLKSNPILPKKQTNDGQITLKPKVKGIRTEEYGKRLAYR